MPYFLTQKGADQIIRLREALWKGLADVSSEYFEKNFDKIPPSVIDEWSRLWKVEGVTRLPDIEDVLTHHTYGPFDVRALAWHVSREKLFRFRKILEALEQGGFNTLNPEEAVYLPNEDTWPLLHRKIQYHPYHLKELWDNLATLSSIEEVRAELEKMPLKLLANLGNLFDPDSIHLKDDGTPFPTKKDAIDILSDVIMRYVWKMRDPATGKGWEGRPGTLNG